MDPKSVINWVKKAAKQIQDIIKDSKAPENVEIVELDEMCNIKKSQINYGFGQLSSVKQKR